MIHIAPLRRNFVCVGGTIAKAECADLQEGGEYLLHYPGERSARRVIVSGIEDIGAHWLVDTRPA